MKRIAYIFLSWGTKVKNCEPLWAQNWSKQKTYKCNIYLQEASPSSTKSSWYLFLFSYGCCFIWKNIYLFWGHIWKEISDFLAKWIFSFRWNKLRKNIHYQRSRVINNAFPIAGGKHFQDILLVTHQCEQFELLSLQFVSKFNFYITIICLLLPAHCTFSGRNRINKLRNSPFGVIQFYAVHSMP